MSGGGLPLGRDPAERVPQGHGAVRGVTELGQDGRQDLAYGLLARCLDGAGAARGAEQGADSLVQAGVAPNGASDVGGIVRRSVDFLRMRR